MHGGSLKIDHTNFNHAFGVIKKNLQETRAQTRWWGGGLKQDFVLLGGETSCKGRASSIKAERLISAEM